MIRGTITRSAPSVHGVFGDLEIDGGFKCKTLELPWKGNRNGESCIPAGTYLFKWRTDSPKHGACYEEWDDPSTPQKEDVPDRTYCQIHPANLAGDTSKGYVAQLLGCIALGLGVKQFAGGVAPAGPKAQLGVYGSRPAVQLFEQATKMELLKLTIRWVDGVNPEAKEA